MAKKPAEIDDAVEPENNPDPTASTEQPPEPVESYDDRQLRLAEEAVAAEAREDEAEPSETPPPADDAGKQAPPTGQQPAEGAGAEAQPGTEEPTGPEAGAKPEEGAGSDEPGGRVPLSRLNEVAGQRDQAREEAAYWKGRAEAAAQQQGGPSQQQQQQRREPTPQEVIRYVRQQEIDLAKQLDDGDISYAEHAEKAQQLRDWEWSARMQMAQAQQPQSQQPARSDDLSLKMETEKIRQAHPYVAKLGDDDLNFLARKAEAQMAAEGQPLVRDGSHWQALRLRQAIGRLSDTWGPMLLGETTTPPSPGAAQGAATPTNPGNGAKPPPNAQAQALAEKTRLAAEHPPDSATLGTGADQPPFLTEQKVMALSSIDLERMPEAELDRFLANPQ